METGGKLCWEALEFLDQAAVANARSAPPPLRSAMARTWKARWTCLASVAAQDALAATLVNHGVAVLDAIDGADPLPVDMWLDGGG